MSLRSVSVLLLCGLFLFSGAGLAAESFTMDQVVEKAVAAGYDSKILAANLEVSRNQQAQTQARNSFTLSGKLGYTANAGLLGTYTDVDSALGVPTPEKLLGLPTVPTAAQKAAAAELGAATIPIPQTATASLTAAVPGSSGTSFTSIGLTATEKLVLNTYTNNSPAGITSHNTNVAVTLGQTLWDGLPGGQPKAAIDKSRLVLQNQVLGAKTNQLALVLKVRQAFFAMLMAQKNLGVLTEINAKQASLLRQVDIKYQLQQAIRIDLLNAQITARNAALDLQNGQNTLASTRLALSLLMGLDATADYRLEEPPSRPMPAASLEEARTKALSQRIDAQQLNVSIASSRIDLALGQAAANPIVAVNGGINLTLNWTTNGLDDSRQIGTFFAGLNLGLPILDAGQADAQTSAARNQLNVYQQQADQLTRTVSMQVESAWNTCQVLSGRVETAKQNVEMLALTEKVVQSQVDSGTATLKDALNATANLATAELAQLQAEFNLQTAILNLENTMGQ